MKASIEMVFLESSRTPKVSERAFRPYSRDPKHLKAVKRHVAIDNRTGRHFLLIAIPTRLCSGEI